MVEKPDVVMANFRKILKEKQAKKIRKRKQVLSYGMKLAMVLVFFVGAVALKNQTDQIRKMKEQLSNWDDGENVQETFSEQVLIEELPGNVESVVEMVYEELVQSEENTEIPITNNIHEWSISIL